MLTLLFLRIDANMISSAIGPYTTLPGVSDLLSVYGKYATVSGWDKFQEGFVNSLLDYAMTASVPTSLPTATNAAAVANDPGFKKINSEVAAIITQYIATETHLAKTDKMALATDLLSVSAKIAAIAKATDAAGVSAAAAQGAKGAAQTGAPQGGAAPAPVGAGLKLAAAAGAAVVAVAYVL